MLSTEHRSDETGLDNTTFFIYACSLSGVAVFKGPGGTVFPVVRQALEHFLQMCKNHPLPKHSLASCHNSKVPARNLPTDESMSKDTVLPNASFTSWHDSPYLLTLVYQATFRKIRYPLSFVGRMVGSGELTKQQFWRPICRCLSGGQVWQNPTLMFLLQFWGFRVHIILYTLCILICFHAREAAFAPLTFASTHLYLEMRWDPSAVEFFSRGQEWFASAVGSTLSYRMTSPNSVG